ncbi:MAG TPA: peptidase S41 [Bacteroidales bacterium]|nr:peptidase S41 [Bacteroidales bacterium]
MMKSFLLSLVSFFLLLSSSAKSSEPYFLSFPALSPDGKTVVFSFEGDLWKADAASGQAMRLTAMQGYETNARISPDGKWIAFSGRQLGNSDIYIIPIEGGDVKQITFHSANDDVENWSWDSKWIYFNTGRVNGSTWRVPAAGGNPEPIVTQYFNRIHNVAEHPKTGELFFNDTWESSSMAHRKGYKGEFNPEIQSWNPKTNEYKKYTDYLGKDMWATIDRDGVVYFVSDQKNGQYNLCKLDNGKTRFLTNFDTSIRRPFVSTDGSKVIFEKDYQLYVYDVKSDKSSKLNIGIVRNNLLPKELSYNITGTISDFDVSPDNKKIAFVSRGDLFVSDIEGKFIRKIDRNTVVETHNDASLQGPSDFERVMSVKWLSDNKTLLFNQTWNGYLNWFTISADGKGEVKQHTKDLRNNRDIEFNEKRTEAAYISGRDELRQMDLKTLESKTIVTDEFWGFQNGAPGFSPDGSYVLYTAKRNFEDDIFVYNLKSKEITNLTGTGVAENGPVWSSDGKYIYFSTNRLKPSYPSGGGENHVYRMALDKFDTPYRMDEFDKLFKKDSAGAKKDTTLNISINTDRIWDRFELISPAFGTQGGAYLIQKGDKVTVLYMSNHDKGTMALWKTTLAPFEAAKTEKIEGLPSPGGIVKAGDKYYALSGGAVYKLNIDGNKAEKIEMNHSFTRDMQAEFIQMFDETWANLEEDFYDEDLHGVDWKGFRKQYAAYLTFLNNRNDFRILMTDMLGEMNSSHMGFSTTGSEEASRLNYTTLEPGIEWDQANPLKVGRVFPRSVSDRKGIDIQPGDVLVAVDQKPVGGALPRDYYFYRPAMTQELLFTFSREGKEYDVKVHPAGAGAIGSYRYEEWIDDNRNRVNKLSDNKIAYVHMKNMGGGELGTFIMTLTRELEGKKGLILDLRYNTGGNVHDDVLRFLQQKTYLKWKSRGGKLANQSNFSPSDFPIVLLINEQSLSDAEMTSAGFKQLGLGKVIGTESYRWIIFTSGKGLVDGSFYRLPGWGCYTLDGQNLEKEGVKPDIYVKQTFLDRIQGKDPQIERAVAEILR